MIDPSLRNIVFWQGIISPHMAFLARDLRALGHDVTYVAGAAMSAERAVMGWQAPDLPGVRIEYAATPAEVDALLDVFPRETIHLVQGVRGKGFLGHAIAGLRQRRLRWGGIVETIKEDWNTAHAKRFVYSLVLASPSRRPDFLLAIGEKTPDWLAKRGFPNKRIFPFTYFLDSRTQNSQAANLLDPKFCVGYVGQFIERKRIDLLLKALCGFSTDSVKLLVVGAGPLEQRLKNYAHKHLGRMQIGWLGQLPMQKTREVIQSMDCLVLPSRHDGWGAVVTEALMVGVPAICSDGCGAAEAVKASGVGGVFPNGDVAALRDLLKCTCENGRLSLETRADLARWARCFDAAAGAGYLVEVLNSVYHSEGRPRPPWAR